MNTTDMKIPSNKVRDIERYICRELEGLYPDGEVRMMTRILFEGFLGWDQVRLLTSKEETVNQSDLLRFHWAVEELKRYRPIQQIIGWTEFCGCRIAVDENTLIPRPETEEIVQRTISILSEKRPKRVLDICTGSGCIAIALAKQWAEAEVTAIDISEKALEKARENGTANGVEIDWRRMDVLSGRGLALPHPFDLIISNPPYVTESERKDMQKNVLDWEPDMALFVPDDDPLSFYKAIAREARQNLATGGMVVVEINERFGQETAQIFKEEGFETEIQNDFKGKERMIIAKKGE